MAARAQRRGNLMGTQLGAGVGKEEQSLLSGLIHLEDEPRVLPLLPLVFEGRQCL